MACILPSKRILVVDDNYDAADMTAELLSLHGHVTTVAYGGREAIETAMDFLPEVILLDLGMPVIDGFAVAMAVRQIPVLSGCVLIAYSAWNDSAIRKRSLTGGFDRHLVKPAPVDEILQAVATAHSN